uniref:Uncharacterized protein n=1 Tax=Physcomitrium patens TaxID=3218 RepID=A0A2K1IJL9_PHYPA|nr:hypothetical protein PHYPA_028166 [Physcomitrium patens]
MAQSVQALRNPKKCNGMYETQNSIATSQGSQRLQQYRSAGIPTSKTSCSDCEEIDQSRWRGNGGGIVAKSKSGRVTVCSVSGGGCRKPNTARFRQHHHAGDKGVHLLDEMSATGDEGPSKLRVIFSFKNETNENHPFLIPGNVIPLSRRSNPLPSLSRYASARRQRKLRCCFALLDSALHLHFCCRGGNIAEEFDTRNFSMNVAEGVRWWRESCRQLRRCEVD